MRTKNTAKIKDPVKRTCAPVRLFIIQQNITLYKCTWCGLPYMQIEFHNGFSAQRFCYSQYPTHHSQVVLTEMTIPKVHTLGDRKDLSNCNCYYVKLSKMQYTKPDNVVYADYYIIIKKVADVTENQGPYCDRKISNNGEKKNLDPAIVKVEKIINNSNINFMRQIQ